MSWTCRLSKQAAQTLRDLPRKHQKQLARALDEMAGDPTVGEVRPIKSGKFKGALRRRVGRYRIIFAVAPQRRVIDVAALLARSEKTYK